MQHIKNKNIKWWLGLSSCIVLFLGIGSFSYIKMRPLWSGVSIRATLDKERNGGLATITGKAANAVYVTLNGREIFIDRDGTFTEPVALLPGLGIVTLEAQDKFGKVSEKQFQVMYKEDGGIVAFNEQ